jgi:Type III restriction enzyme, res subunit
MDNFDVTGLLAPQVPHSQVLCQSLLDNGFAWDSSPCGTGKTYSAAAVLRYLATHKHKKFVVISPKLNIPKWNDVLAKFGVKAEWVLNYELLGRGNLKKIYRYKKKVKRGLPHFLRGEWRIPKDWVVIMDESHRTKGVESLNAGMVYDLKNQGYSVLMMSATQALTPLDMRAFGYISGLHKGMHETGGRGQNNGMNLFKAFCETAGAEFTGSFGAMKFDKENMESKVKLKAATHDVLFHKFGVAARMNREDFGDLLPHNQVEANSYDMGINGQKIGAVYSDMQRELAKLEDRTNKYKNHVLAIIIAARRQVELLKVPTFCEITEDWWDEGKSILHFVNYTDTIDALYERLVKKFGAEWIGKVVGTGQTFKQRHDDLAALAADKKRIMLVNIAAGSECIDMHDVTGKHPRAELINPSFRAISVLQSIYRADRAGALSDILTSLVLASGTIEDSVGANFNNKKGHLDILNDGDLIPDGIAFDVSQTVAGKNI